MPEDFQERRQRRIDRLRQRADRAGEEAHRAHQAADGILRFIPPGQPILVGHHSEKRHRRDLQRADGNIRRSIEAGKRADELNRRAAAAEANTAIFSDDPEAVEKLRGKLAKLEEEQARMKRVNAAYRKGDAALAALGFSPKEIARMRKQVAQGYSWEKAPFAGFELTNNNANIRRIRERIKQLERQAKAVYGEIPFTAFGGGRLVLNAPENRVQIFFDEKPSPEKRHEMKRQYAFRYAPSINAWQRHYSESAMYWAKVIVGLPTDATAPAVPETTPSPESDSDAAGSEEEKVCARCGREADRNNPLRRIVFLDENGADTDRELDACYSCFGLYVTERGVARSQSEANP